MARRKKVIAKLSRRMRLKLFVLFSGITIGMCGLIGRLMYIEYTSGDKYEKKVLSLQSYDSVTLPFQRGDIVDTNGTVLATSVAVYNVILDCSVMTSDEKYIEPTISALVECFPDLSRGDLEDYAKNKKNSRYIVLEKKLSYDTVQPFVEMQNKRDEDDKLVHPNIKGVWFETEYQRVYPFGSLASSVIGFTSAGNVGTIGLENYYDSVLNGVNGREYGYLNADSDFEKTVIAAKDGNKLVCSLDANIQSIVEENIKKFDKTYTNNYENRGGFKNCAVVVMNPNNGEILAMADYPSFDLNNPRDLSGLYSQQQLEEMTDDETMDVLNQLWQNYCVTATYEPGSVQKPFTVSCGLETGTITEDMTFNCDGKEIFAGSPIHCVNRNGHGLETVEKSLMDSCNDALMQMSYRIGAENFLEYQSIFGFGPKTGIDLPGEANTTALMYTLDNIRSVDLATNSFGQNYNCTMIQMISAFSSLVNGGTYYQPHIVRKITDAKGNTISTIDATAVKQTISESTCETIKGYMERTVAEGTAKTAKVDGYSMGGKTGTAQKLPRGNKKYLVSFMGFVPVENPQIVIYCIIDEPNVEYQAHSSYAQNIAREILKEVLPYMNIYPDEELAGTNADLDITGNNPPEGGGPVEEPSTAGDVQTSTGQDAAANENPQGE